jgi:choline dehydrogenase
MQPSSFTHIASAQAQLDAWSHLASHRTRYSVLLVKAGPDYGLSEHVPSTVRDARQVPMRGQSEIYDAEHDWNLNVEMPYSSSMAVPQAKIMGGGSSIDSGTALRSTRADSEE